MSEFRILAATYLLMVALCASGAAAANVIVGVNVVGVQTLSEPQQDALVALLQKEGVRTVRTGLGDKFTHFITSAFQHGIGAVVIVDPLAGNAVATACPPGGSATDYMESRTPLGGRCCLGRFR
jgi:hypothetical protein